MNDELEPFSTSDTPFAAFLAYHNHKIVGLRKDPNDYRRRVFVLVKLPETEELFTEYYELSGGKPSVEPKHFYRCVRDMYKLLEETNEK